MLHHIEYKEIRRQKLIKASTFNAYQMKLRKDIFLKYLELKM